MGGFSERLRDAQKEAHIRHYGSEEAYNKVKKRDEQAVNRLLWGLQIATWLFYLGVVLVFAALVFYGWNYLAPFIGLKIIPFPAAVGIVSMLLVVRWIMK